MSQVWGVCGWNSNRLNEPPPYFSISHEFEQTWIFVVFCFLMVILSLRWRHNGHDGVSNNLPHHCLLSRLFGCRSKKTSKLRVTGLCAGNSPGTGGFPAQMASNAENISIWWRHHDGLILSVLVEVWWFVDDPHCSLMLGKQPWNICIKLNGTKQNNTQ